MEVTKENHKKKMSSAHLLEEVTRMVSAKVSIEMKLPFWDECRA